MAQIEMYKKRIIEINEHQVNIENYKFNIYNSRNDKFQDKKLNLLLGVGCKYFSETVNYCFDNEQKYCEDISINYYINPFYLHHTGQDKEIYGIFIQQRFTLRGFNTPLGKYGGGNTDLLQITSIDSNILTSRKLRKGHTIKDLQNLHFKNINCEDLLFEKLEILRYDERYTEGDKYPSSSLRGKSSFSSLRGTYFLSKEDFFNLLKGNNKIVKLSGVKNSKEINVNNPNFNSNLKIFKVELDKFIN